MATPGRGWRLSRLFRRGREADALERGLHDEVQFHLDQETEKNVRHGMSPEAARRAAFVRFGGVEALKERTRDEFRPAFVQDFWRDTKIGARTFARSPGFAALTILTMGLGIGAATAVFSVVNGVLLRPLPYPEPDRLVRLYQLGKDGARSGNVSGPNVEDWQALTHSFAGIARMSNWGPTPVVGPSEPALAVTTPVSREFFDVIGVHPAMGRGFSAEELVVGGPPAAIVSRAVWRRMLEASPAFSAHPVRVGGGEYTVVGVMPEGFDYPNGTGVWLAREHQPPDKARTAHNFQVIARLRDGVPVESARADLSRVSRDLKTRYGDDTWMFDATLVPLLEQMTTASTPVLRLLFGAALMLLIIATLNVSSLLLARAAARQHQFAVQLALGAGRARLVRQLIAESAVLCLAGGVAGGVIATLAVRALVVLGPRSTPRLADASVDWVALAFALGVSAAATLVLGALTAVGARDVRLSSALAAGARTASAGRRGLVARQVLVVVQVGMTLVLLAGTGVLAQSFIRLMKVDPGFSLDNALVVDLAVTDGGADYRVRRVAQVDELLARMSRLPGVTHAGMTSGFPLGGGNYANGQFLEMTSADEFKSFADVKALGAGAKARAGYANYRIASGDYFKTMGIPLLRGRVFDDTDGPDAPHVAVISQSFADLRWAGRDPIDRFIQYGNMDGDLHGFRIIGVVGDVHEESLESEPAPTLYGSYRQRPNSLWRVSVIVRGPEPDSLVPSIRRVVHEVNPSMPVQTRTIDQALDATLTSRRFSLILITVFGASALMLAVFGLYALIAYIVAQRARGISIRMALGATSGNLLALILGRGAVLAVTGCAAGLIAALMLSHLVQGMVFGIAPTDPPVLAFVVTVTLVASLAATFWPARRATRVSPVNSLRI